MGWGNERLFKWSRAMVKTIKNLLLWNQKADDPEIWYAASGTWVLPGLFNDNPGLALTYFTERSKLVPFVFVWENAKSVDFQETIEACSVKISTYSQINEYMMIYNNPRTMSIIDTQIQRFQTAFHQKTRLKQNFVWNLHGMLGWKFVQMFRVTWSSLLLRNEEVDDIETWYTASGTQVLPNLFKDDTGLTLPIFMIWSDLFPNASAYTAYSHVFPSLF